MNEVYNNMQIGTVTDEICVIYLIARLASSFYLFVLFFVFLDCVCMYAKVD